MNRVARTAAAAALGLALLGGAIGTSFAEDPTPTPAAQAQQWQRGPGHGAGVRQGAGFGFQALSGEVADALGMTADQIRAERLAGKSLAEIAAAKGMSEDKLVELMLAARKKLLDQRVAAGTLTQAQADAAYTQMQARVKDGIERTEVGPNRPADGVGLGLGWGRGAQAGTMADYGQPGQGTGPGMARHWGASGR